MKSFWSWDKSIYKVYDEWEILLIVVDFDETNLKDWRFDIFKGGNILETKVPWLIGKKYSKVKGY